MGSNPGFAIHGCVVSGTLSTVSELVSSSTNGGLWVLDSGVNKTDTGPDGMELAFRRWREKGYKNYAVHPLETWQEVLDRGGAGLVKECPWRRRRVRGDLQKMQT